MNVSFHAPAEVIVRRGAWREALPRCTAFGQRVLAITGAATWERGDIGAEITAQACELGVELHHRTIAQEPTVSDADAAAEFARSQQVQVVLGFGGGSALDLAKAVALLSVNEGSARDYCEGMPTPPRIVKVDPLPVIAVPTTAGTGSEVTRNSVLHVEDLQVKRSLRDVRLVPRVALVDPDLSAAAPYAIRCATAFDALTHVIESYLSLRASPFTDGMASNAIPALAAALGRLVQRGEQADDSETIAWAASLGGICLANAGLGAAHGLVAPLGGLYPRAPHGAALACLLPAMLEVTAAAQADRCESMALAERLRQIGSWLGCASLADGIAMLHDWRRLAQIPDLAVYAQSNSSDVDVFDMAAVVRNPSGSLKTHPIVLSEDELRRILVLAGCSPT